MTKIPVSVCIIAKNEEKYIEGCLKHLQPYGMEIVIADTGSVDRTKEIASKYVDKIVDFAWCNDFSAARNYCAKQASNDWILALDCDEYVETLNVPELRRYLQHFPKCTGKVSIKSIMNGGSGGKRYFTELLPRLYNRKYYRFRYEVHEMISLLDAENGEYETHETFVMPMEVIHYGYDISSEEMERKQKRNLELLYQSLKAGNIRGGYTYYQIGQSEEVLKNFSKAVEAYENCFAADPDISKEYIRKAAAALGACYAQAGRVQDAVTFMKQYQGRINTPYFTYTYGQVLLLNGQHLKALLQFILVTTMADKESLGTELATCYQHIRNLYLEFGEEKMAETFQAQYELCLRACDRVLKQ